MINTLFKIINLTRNIIEPIIVKKNLFSSIYYTFSTRRFGREQQAVLAGKLAFNKKLKDIGKTSSLLRRNIHRLEKALTMQPRRNIFAEQVIFETVKIYDRAIKQGNLDSEEKKWATDVLEKYFDTVHSTNIISEAKKKFESCMEQNSQTKKFVPYKFKSLPKHDITFDQLTKLFLKRRSVRWYKDKNVPMDLIVKAINSAKLAPSACNRQPYYFYVSQSSKKAVEIASCAGGTPGWGHNIPCTIAIIGDLSAYSKEQERHCIYVDGALASMQLMLALETLGLSSCSINWPDIESREKKIAKLLDLKSYERPIMLLSVGYAKDEGEVPYSSKKSHETLIKHF